MQVDLVSVQTSDGVNLDGALRTPAASSNARLGLDLVIFHHGSFGNFYRQGMIASMGDRLLEDGCAALHVNSRGHDEVVTSPRGRLGTAFEIVDDCRLDWNAWLDFAEAAGYRRIALWGTASDP